MSRTKTTSAGYVRVDDELFQRLRADVMKNRRARVHVGVLGGFGARAEGGQTNAEIGAVHEFGVVAGHAGTAKGQRDRKLGGPNARLANKNLPARSWLRMPVLTALPDALKKTQQGQWHAIFIKQGLIGALRLLGAYALDVIHLAFETKGFGSWAPLAAATVRRKKAKGGGAAGPTAILIDTAQLRQSITAEVVNSP